MQMDNKRKHTGQLKLGPTGNLTQRDKHFWNIFPFIGLKLFRYYNKVI